MAVRQHAIYRRLDNPPGDAARGSCYLTGQSGACVDTGADIYNEGTLVISVSAVREMAEVAGFNVVDGVELEVRNAELERENKDLILKVNELQGELDALDKAVARNRKRSHA